jgi:hypothetical protein
VPPYSWVRLIGTVRQPTRNLRGGFTPHEAFPYAEPMGQGDVPASPGGPLRRRRERRQLGQLADKSEREVSPTAAKGHVRVIEDQPAEKEEGEPKGQELD